MKALRKGFEVALSLHRMLRSLSFAFILFDASFVIATGRGLHEFATADFFDDASAKPLPNLLIAPRNISCEPRYAALLSAASIHSD